MSLEENNESNGGEPAKTASASTNNTLGKEVSAKLANIKEIKANIKHNFSTLTKKPSDPDKHEPGRFLGEGVAYRAKLIGILEVGDARGDRMCQEALADLKMAIRAAGEHKQRITIHIAIDGLRLRDDKTGDCLYHHPVHKISFIAQDMTDSRAFGYIFGSPDTGHRFFGIKTDKAASQVVISMRDLFQVVFELKKKEIEMAKQHIEQHQIKYGMGLVPEPPQKISSLVGGDSGGGKMRTIAEDSAGAGAASSGAKETETGAAAATSTRKSNKGGEASGGGASEAAIADLLDLELELNSIQQGLSQMERITPSDPFGDSFAPPPPPPPAAKLLPPPPSAAASKGAAAAAASKKNWFGADDAASSGAVAESLFSDDQQPPPTADGTASASATTPTKTEPPMSDLTSNELKDQFDVFTELDPLGTGRSKPYIDKKDFFQELKNPPKKVLKDLVSELPKESPPLFQASFESESISTPSSATTNGVIDLKSDPVFPVTVSSDPFGDDPFDKTDPFDENSMSKVFFPNMQTSKDPFDTCFADFTAFGRSNNDNSLTNSLDDVDAKHRKSPRLDEGSDSSIHGPLRVSLPPEKQLSTSPRSRNKYGRTSSLVKLPSPKQKSRTRASRQATMDSSFDRSSPMDGMTLKNCAVISPSPPPAVGGGLLDSAPDPPPRPPITSSTTTTTTTPIIKPPPLPPKRQVTGMTPMKQPFRPLQLDYDYIENYETLGSQSSTNSNDVKSPPIPVPARRPRFSGGGGDSEHTTAPQRPLKQNLSTSEGSEPEYYLTPFPLLPPPVKKSSSPKPEHSRSLDNKSVLKESAKQSSSNTSSLDITLSQLSKTGFSDLASTLGMSPTSLSRMTLQELTKCLQNLNEVEKAKTEDKSGSVRTSIFKSEQYSALRESIEEDAAPFKAEFDSHFNSAAKESVSGGNEESLFDKYAVFRELLEQEKLDSKAEEEEEVDEEEEEEETNIVEEVSRVEESGVARVATAPLAKSEEIDDLPDSDEVHLPVVSTSVSEDRYAALRDINFDDDFIQEEEEEDEREESVGKAERGVKEGGDDCEEEGSRSRQHSESTESPTATMKEPQSIMETTIIEEDISALEADEDDVPEEVMGEMELSLPTVAESSDKVQASPASKRTGVEDVPSLKEELVDDLEEDDEEEEEEEEEGGRKSLTITNLIEGWAKFDNNDKTSEGNVSPWSIDSKDINKETFWKERPDRVVERSKVRKGRKTADDDWGGEDGDESEEGWRWDDDGRWRGGENGWSDGESLYDEPPPPVQYHHAQRRGRRRRVSPRRKTSRDPSPWEEEEEERWEESRRADEYRPKHRGSSLDEDRRKRRLSPWTGGEPDRRSSRESLAWEEEEQRYSRRPYRDRRHRRYEEPPCYSSSRSSREYRDQTRRNYQGYYRDRSHESPWEDSEQGEEDSPRCQTRKQAWSSRPQDSEEEMYRYSRSSDPRKTQTMKGRGNRGKKRGQTSPFEDDFSAHTFQFPSDSKSPGSDASEQFPAKHSPCQSGKPPHLSPDYYLAKKEFDNGVVEAKTKGNNNRQSPFEDDFTPPETRRYSGRSVSSDASDKSGRKETGVDVRCNDDVFIPEYRQRCERFMSEITAKGRRGRSSNLNGDLSSSDARRHDGESVLRRNDSGSMSRKHDDRRHDSGESAMSRRQDGENTLPRRQDSESMMSRRQDSEGMKSRRQDSEGMMCRRLDGESIMSKRQDSESMKSRRQDSEGMMSRRLDGESIMSKRQDSESVMSRRHESDNMSPLAVDSVGRRSLDKHSFGEMESPPSSEATSTRRRLNSDLKSSEVDSPSPCDPPPAVRHSRRGQAGDLKFRVSSLRRTDSSSSLRKSESVNIFARSNDPFDDDDFFSAADSTTLPRMGGREDRGGGGGGSGGSATHDPFKWAEAFNAFNFDTTSAFFDEDRK